jgi:hypothetical protein
MDNPTPIKLRPHGIRARTLAIGGNQGHATVWLACLLSGSAALGHHANEGVPATRIWHQRRRSTDNQVQHPAHVPRLGCLLQVRPRATLAKRSLGFAPTSPKNHTPPQIPQLPTPTGQTGVQARLQHPVCAAATHVQPLGLRVDGGHESDSCGHYDSPQPRSAHLESAHPRTHLCPTCLLWVRTHQPVQPASAPATVASR